MSTTTPLPTLPPAASQFLATVAQALADLPDGEREDLIEEVGAHLADVSDELGPDLDAASLLTRLGAPEAYAAELRSAAGYESEPVSHPRRRLTERARARGRRVWAAVEDRPGAEGVRRLLVELRPAWWVARAWILLSWLSLGDPGRPLGVVPHALNNVLVNLCLLIVAVAASVWLGRRVTAPQPSWRRVAIVANVVLVIGCIPVLMAVQNRTGSWNDVRYSEAAPSASAAGPIVGDDGQATNLFAFTPDGKLIPRFYLYDENGQPVDIGTSDCADQSAAPALPFDNAYPREQYIQKTDSFGNVTADCVPAGTAPGFGVTIPTAPSASASPSPSASAG